MQRHRCLLDLRVAVATRMSSRTRSCYRRTIAYD